MHSGCLHGLLLMDRKPGNNAHSTVTSTGTVTVHQVLAVNSDSPGLSSILLLDPAQRQERRIPPSGRTPGELFTLVGLLQQASGADLTQRTLPCGPLDDCPSAASQGLKGSDSPTRGLWKSDAAAGPLFPLQATSPHPQQGQPCATGPCVGS